MFLKLLLVISMVATMLGAIAPLMSASAARAKTVHLNQHLLSAELQGKALDYNSLR
ncbi:MAG: hypothetical protein ACOH5I_14320 [Oligoflexus sp.]